MRGRLVPQIASETPASGLIKQIAAERAALVKAGKLRAPKPLKPIADSDKPHAIPASWEWVRLGDIGEIFNGNSINASEKELKYVGKEGLPYIATKDVGYGLDALDYENGVSIPKSESQFKVAHAGAVLICAEGGSAGKKCGVTDRDVCFGNKLFANELFGGIPPLFVLYAYLSPFFAVEFSREMTGIIGGVSIARFIEIPVPLPPLEEQKRIVARIDELMSRCDELESQRAAHEAKRCEARAATMRHWLVGDDAAAALLGEHFATLIRTREDAAELRKAILQLAVLGKLVGQDPADTPASEFLKQIAVEKAALAKVGKIRTQKTISPIADSEIPHTIPRSWEWVRLENIVDVGTGSTPTTSNPRYYDGSIPWYTSSATNKLVADEPEKFITDLAIKETNCKVFPVGTLIIALYGQGKTRGQVSEIAQAGATNQAIAALVFSNASAPLRRYLKYFFIKSYEALREQAAGAAQPNLNVGKIKETLIPLPPLEEQKRIVSRIDAMMHLCDTLEQSIDAAQAKQAELLDAVMARL